MKFFRLEKFLFFLFIVFMNEYYAQLNIYSEDFEDDYQEGCGYGSCSDDNDGNWYLTQVGTPDNNGSQSSWDDVAFFDGAAVIPSSDLAFRWNDNNDGVTTNREDWYSKVVSGAYTNISISIPYWIGSTGTGSIWAYYILDGGAPVLIGSVSDGTNTSGTLTVSGLTSTTSVQITVQAVNSNSNAAYVKIDNVSITADCPASYSGTYQVGPTGTWSTLTDALFVLKSCMVDDVILELQSTYTDASETYPLDFSGLPTSSTESLIIRPKSDVSSTIVFDGSSSTTILDLDATNYVTIDGRPGGSGTTSRFTFKNTTAAAASKRALIIQNNSSNNTITYCTLLSDNSSTTNSTAGVVFFGNGASGNSNNSITNCTITYATTATACLIVSYNSSASTSNTSNTISNNTLTDFTNHGIWCDTKSTSFVISSNQIYQTATAYSTSTAGTYLIYITSGTDYTINGNYIGGAGANCNSADYFTVNANGSIYGINFGGTGAGTNNIYDNTIKYLKSNSTTATSVAVGIYLNNATSTALNIYNNTIQYMKAGSSSTAAVHYSAGMLSTGTCSSLSLSVYKNIVKNIENAMGSSSSAYLYGIDFSSSTSATTNYYYNNFVNLDYGANAARIYGISTGATSVVYNNTIYVYSGSNQTYDRYCLKIKGSVNNTIKNNLFINVSSSTSGNTKYSADIYVNGSGGTQTHSYNYYQFTGTYSSSVNNNGSATSWTAETGGQTNTDVALDSDGRATPSSSRIADLGTDLRASSPAITEDIIAESRSDASPWIGCFEGNASFYWVGGSGNWSSYASHWATTSGGSTFQTTVPTSTDNVYFDANSGGGTCTIDGASTCNNITTTGYTGTIAVGANTLTISGTATLPTTVTISTGTIDADGNFDATGGNLTFSGAGNLNLGGATITSLGTLSTTAGTVNYDRSGIQDIVEDIYFNLTISGNSTKSVVGTTTQLNGNGLLLVESGATLAIGNNELKRAALGTSGGSSISGTVTINDGLWTTTYGSTQTLVSIGGTITCTGTGTIKHIASTLPDFGTFTAGSGTVLYNRAGDQSIASAPTYYNLTLSGSTKNIIGTTTVGNNLSITSTTAIGSYTINVGGSATITGTATISTGTLNVDGTFDATGGTLTFSGAGNLYLGGATVTSLGTFTCSTSTVYYDYAGAQTILSDNYYNLTIANSGTKTLGGNIDVDGDLTISIGTLDASGSNYEISCAGNWVNNGTFSARSARVIFNGSSSKTVTGTSATAFYELEVDKGTSISTVLEITDPASITYNCVFTNGLLKLSNNSITASDVVTATTDISATSGLHINGATYSTSSNAVLNNSGYLRVTSGTATIGTASDNTTYNESSTSVFILDGGTVDCYGRFRAAAGSVTISSGTLTIGTGSIDNIATRGGFEIASGSDFSMTGGAVVLKARNPNASGNDLYIVSGGTKTISGGTFQIGNASTVASRIFKINSDISLYNLTINSTNSPTGILQQNTTILNDFTNSGIFDANTSGPFNLTVNGAFTNNGTFTAQTGTVIFNGSSAQTISGTTDPSFYNMTINNSSTGVTLGLNTTLTNTLNLTDGLLNTSSYTLTLGTNSSNATVPLGSSSSYIVAYDNAGSIGYVKQFINSNTTYNFPIGDATHFTPLTFTLNSNGGLASANLILHTKAATISGMNSGLTTYISRYWELTENGFTTPNYDVSYVYDDGDITGTEANLLPVKLSGATWYKPTGSLFTTGTSQGAGSVTVGTNTLTWTGLSTFSFYGGAGDQGVALPIELLSFDAKPYNKDVIVKWETASEIDNDYFLVERSTDGISFETIGNIDGAGFSNHKISYFMIDQDFEHVINYYRLRQVDFNGEETISKIVAIDLSKQIGVIVMTVNTLGQEVNENYSGVVFDIYSDGTSVKRIK